MERHLSRRTALTLAGAAALASCGPQRPEPAGGRVVEHRFGTTTVPAEPARVVALGVGDTEAAMALGVVPLAGTDVLGLDDLSRPWVSAALHGRPRPAVLDWRELPYEEIVRLRPDVVLYVNSPGDRQVFDTLSSIAPTIGPPPSEAETFGVEWRAQLRLVAAALGRGPQADAVVASVDDTLAGVRRSHPGLEGLTVVGGLARPDALYFWPERDPRTRLLEELGLRASPALADLDDSAYLLALSPERYDLLRCDVLYLSVLDRDGEAVLSAGTRAALEQVEAVRRGRVVWAPGPDCYGEPTADGDLAGALALGGALGIPACVDRLADDVAAVLTR